MEKIGSENKYMFIGGSTKCGTTSLFKYFQFHPQVCPCSMKESRFFWNNDYKLEAAAKRKPNPPSFNDLFSGCDPDQIKLEATPDYLYSARSASEINKLKGEVLFIFILRKPADRFISWYNYASQNGLLDSDLSVNDYFKLQESNIKDQPQHLRSLDQGNYSKYLEPYIDIIGRENILVVYYEDLKEDARALCDQISNFVGIDNNYFGSYDFKIHNRSVAVQSRTLHKVFRSLRRGVRPITHKFSIPVRKSLKLAGQGFESAYYRVNKKNYTDDLNKNSSVLKDLNEYFSQEPQKLKKLLGVEPPWNTPIE